MPYSITTKDGITINDIPDDVPADAPQLRERVAKIRGQGAPAQPGSITAPKSGYLMGLRDPIDAGAQILENLVPDGVATKVNQFNNYLADKGFPVSRVEESGKGATKLVQQVNQQYDRQRNGPTGLTELVTGQKPDPGFDWGRLAGNVINPVNAVAGPSMVGARTVGQLALRGAAQGAISGALQPVTSDDATDNFWTRKAGQAALGAVTGGIATPVVARATTAIGNSARGALNRRAARAVAPEQIDVAAANVARQGGYEWGDIPESMQQAIRTQVQESLGAGRRLDPAAVLRIAEAEAVGLRGDAGLTAGQATGNPMQFTQERNLRGVEIATPQGRGNPLMDRFANQNQALGRNFEQLGAGQATEAGTAGQTMIDALQASDAPVRAGVDDAYAAARAMNNGRAAPLERGTFSRTANEALDAGQWGSSLPPEARGILNSVSSGNTPFDVDAAVVIDRRLSEMQRAATRSGNEAGAGAIGVVRDALSRAPLQATEFADNGAGQAARDAFDGARRAARARFANIQATPALAAALDNAAPDQFVQRFILNGNARDLQALRTTLEANPEALGQARAQVAAHLQRAAFGENLAGRAQFSPERFAKTLRAIGGQRLSAFFSPEEIQQLNLVARAGSTVNTQPAGSAVNNSNTGSALMTMLGRLAETPMLRRVPGARAVANQLGEMRTERQMTQALSGQLPTPPAELSPETMRALERLFPLAGAAGGSLGGMAIQ